jgi:hypothetical protein
MRSTDLDKIHSERLAKVAGHLPRTRKQVLSRIFVGQKVLETIDKPKVVLDGYRLDKVLSTLPFSPITYVTTCPGCLKTEQEVKQYLSLVKNELIIPVLMGEYADYPDPLVDALRIRDHVSRYELNIFHSVQLTRISRGRQICECCFDKEKDKIFKYFNGDGNETELRELIDDAANKLKPPIYPDYELLGEMENAVKTRDADKMVQLSELAGVIRQVRWAQIWNGALILDAADLASAPENISSELDAGRRTSLALREYVSQGLGVRIPINIPIDRYAELVKEYQPRISAVVDGIIDKAGRQQSTFGAASKEISQLNNEISRIKNLNKYLVLEAIAAPLRHNKALIAAGLTACAWFGLGGGLVGCAGAVAAKSAIKRARNIGAIDGAIEALSKHTEVGNLARKLKTDARPYVDALIAKYLSAKLPAVSVLSIRRAMEREHAVSLRNRPAA